jgi:hypothetical protein
VVEEQVPTWVRYDHRPTGIYEVLSNQHEVVVVWATSIAGQTRLRAARDAALGFGDEAPATTTSWPGSAGGHLSSPGATPT